jgi:hypothetical protein
MTAPNHAPSADELLADPVVQQALEAAWRDSEADDPVQRHEEGGWVYLDLATGFVTTQRAPRGGGSAIDLGHPPALPGCLVVGKFHTHPNPTAEGWNPGPSASDLRIDAAHGVPDLIRADDGVYATGPVSRRGGLIGNPGYPD